MPSPSNRSYSSHLSHLSYHTFFRSQSQMTNDKFSSSPPILQHVHSVRLLHPNHTLNAFVPWRFARYTCERNARSTRSGVNGPRVSRTPVA